MANSDNKLKDLEVEDFHQRDFGDSREDTLANCWYHQKQMQEKVYGYDFSQVTIGQVVDFCFMNKHAIEDEMGEFMDALGGISDGVGNAAWKPWKSANKAIREKKISDLTPSDLKELKMEFVDMAKFFFNFAIVIGMEPKEFYNYFFAKSQENKNRQERGY